MPTALYEITFSCSLPSGEEAVFTHWIQADADADALSAADVYATSLAGDTAFTGLFGTGVVMGPAKVAKTNMATGVVISTQVATVQVAGTATVGNLPPQCSIVVSLRTAFASRSDRGRYYLPAISSDQLTPAGRLSSTPQNAILSAVVAAHSAEILVGAGCPLVVYSRKNRAVEPVVSIDVGDVIDTQRRRRDKLVESRVSALL